MTGQIRVSPEVLQGRAREYGKASNDINAILSNLQRLQDTLRGEWEGQAFQGFDAQFNELKPKVQNFAELLKQCNNTTKTYHVTLGYNSNKIIRDWGRTSISCFLKVIIETIDIF